ncbi:hypothetical protein A2Y85_02165 [candidate division WOR-3 bacterium RBG_13_43_14]|uniref:Lipoprotein n=1 Tax=candidate division WOR-3 bacterium RBG_13_43_14 TaxID=1802590 RepID=A0A1F4U8J0_UNCW3|nr:MAG: hypothetical protein A2Y85_02165 [candidate division WOR-3 bacterium RBG_13_43_14]
MRIFSTIIIFIMLGCNGSNDIDQHYRQRMRDKKNINKCQAFQKENSMPITKSISSAVLLNY